MRPEGFEQSSRIPSITHWSTSFLVAVDDTRQGACPKRAQYQEGKGVYVFGSSITNTAAAAFAERVSAGADVELVDVASVAYAIIENGRVYLMHDAGLSDSHGLIAPVLDVARRAGLMPEHDHTKRSDKHLSGNMRMRVFA